MARKYKRGKQIKSVGEFERSKCTWFWVLFGPNEKTMHQSALESWTYRTLNLFISRGGVFEAERKDGEDGKEHRSDSKCEVNL